MPRENLEFILVNTITYTLSKLIEDTLLSYGKDSNIPEEYRPIYNMKNEFFMRVNNVYCNIDTRENLNYDDGEREGHLENNFHVEITRIVFVSGEAQ